MMSILPISALFSVSLIVLSACSSVLNARSPITDKTFPPIPQPEPTLSSPNPPEAVTNALIPDLGHSYSTNYLADTPASFNISVHDVDAHDFFMSLVVDSQENMIVHPEVTGRISLELKNVTIPQVLSAVQKVYGYDYSKTDIGYVIYPATLQTKVFKIDRIDLLREGSSNTRVTSGQLNNNQSNSNRNNNNQGGQNNLNGTPNNPNPNNQTSGSWINTTSKTDFWLELQESLAAIVDSDSVTTQTGELVNSKTGSKVVINKQTGIVVVRANPPQIREVEKLIASTQNQIGRQVVIEAKILEIILDDKHQEGVNWASVVNDGTKAFMTASNPLPTAVTSALDSSVFTISAKSGNFYAYISLMEGQGKTNILSSPRISTLNNQKAVIKVGQDEYFITDVSSTSNVQNSGSFGNGNTIAQDITWTPFFSGIALDVTPQIADDNQITLHIHPSITRVENQTKDFSINGEDNSIPMALNTVRESDSIVHAQNGQIIIIGGLMQENRDENQEGIPLLSRIPYVGKAFREDEGKGKKSELVILLKPTIIENNNDWQTPIEESRQRMQQLEKKQLWK